MSSGTRKLLIPSAAILLLVALAIPKLRSFGGADRKNSSRAAGDQTLAVRVQVVKATKLGDKIATVGTILPDERVEVRSESSGKIAAIRFEEGRRVSKGDLLVKIDDTELQAQLARGQHRRALAEQQEKRQRGLFEQHLVSEEDYERAASELNVVRAEVQLIEAQIAKTEIRAPFDGVVGLRYASEGAYVTPAMLITTLEDAHSVKVDFAVPEKYAGALRRGEPVVFTAHGDAREFTGTIYALESGIDTATRTLRVRATSPNPEGVLRPGAFVNVKVELGERDAVMVPSYAVVPELKGHRVFVLEGGKAESRSVEIGTRTDALVEITNGLEAGDTLITSAMLQLRPGMSVRPTEDS